MGQVQKWWGKVKLAGWLVLAAIAFIWFALRERAARALGKAEAELDHAEAEFDTEMGKIEDLVEKKDGATLKEDALAHAREVKAANKRRHGR